MKSFQEHNRDRFQEDGKEKALKEQKHLRSGQKQKLRQLKKVDWENWEDDDEFEPFEKFRK